MKWVRALRKTNSAFETPIRLRHTWHLLSHSGTRAACNVRSTMSEIVTDTPPSGERVCMNCAEMARLQLKK